MTKLEAITMALTIVNECNKHEIEGNSCSKCVFGIKRNNEYAECMVSNGNDIPHDWIIKDRIDAKL
jgi:hypothetical protein